MESESALDPARRGKLRTRELERAIAVLAKDQHATVARRQLIALGFSGSAIDRIVERGWLRVIHRGVYAVGPARLTQKGRWMAAVLAAGPGARLSHRSAGALWRMGCREGTRIDVTSPRKCHPREGIALHRADLREDECDMVDNIPVTTAARTLLDLAAVLPKDQLLKAIHEAEIARLWDATGLQALVERYPTRPGTPALREIHNERAPITKHDFERLFHAFLQAHDLPRAEKNRIIATHVRPYECDIVWSSRRIVLELDGYETHGTRQSFEDDRERDRALAIAGWTVVRVTWLQFRNTPAAVAKDLRALLAARAGAEAA